MEALWIKADKWLNNSDFTVEADMTGILKATNTEPEQLVNVTASIVVRVKGNKGHVTRGKYQAYEVVSIDHKG